MAQLFHAKTKNKPATTVVRIIAALYIFTTRLSDIFVWTGTITSCKKTRERYLHICSNFSNKVYSHRTPVHLERICIGWKRGNSKMRLAAVEVPPIPCRCSTDDDDIFFLLLLLLFYYFFMY